MENKTTIDTLIARAKALSNGRHRNPGRNRELMPQNEAIIAGKMRKSGCSISSIFRVMAENKMTEYKSYPKFKAAYINHKLHA